jgi:hypothetical protein
MTGRKAMRWLTALAGIVLLVALAIGAALAFAWSSLPPEGATLVIEGERISLPSLSGGQMAAVLALVVFIVLLTAAVVVGTVAIALAAALFGVAVAALVAVETLLLVASPVLLLGWLIWRLSRSPAPSGAQPRLA